MKVTLNENNEAISFSRTIIDNETSKNLHPIGVYGFNKLTLNRFSSLPQTKNEIKEKLEKYGVAVVPDILNKEECSDMFEGMMGDIEHITQDFDVPFKSEDYSTWRSWLELAPLHSMLQQHWKLGHTQTIWNLRQNPKIIKPFEDLWQTPAHDLLSSFDGITVHFPPEITNRGWYRNTWLHTDQSFMRPEFECVQSWVTALDVEEGDGTLTYLRGSHIYHEHVRNKFNITEKKDALPGAEE